MGAPLPFQLFLDFFCTVFGSDRALFPRPEELAVQHVVLLHEKLHEWAPVVERLPNVIDGDLVLAAPVAPESGFAAGRVTEPRKALNGSTLTGDLKSGETAAVPDRGQDNS